MEFDDERLIHAKERLKKRGVKSLGDRRRSNELSKGWDDSKRIRSAPYTDKLVRPFLRGDVTGVLAPSGVGKTTYCLNEIVWQLSQNISGIAVMFILEQDANEINEKWEALTEDCSELADRFYIFSNFDEDMIGKESMSIIDIKNKAKMLKEDLGETLISVTIDHLHLVKNNAADYNPVAVEIKKMAKELDTHVFIVSQTQKANQIIDLPVPRTGCYNCSAFEWNVSNIISIFQPLARVQSETSLSLLGYQFCKIRYKNTKDEIKENMNYLLYFNHDTQSLRELTPNEKTEFSMQYEKVIELRQNEEKYKSFQFDLSTVIKGRDGKEVKLTKIVGGNAGQED